MRTKFYLIGLKQDTYNYLRQKSLPKEGFDSTIKRLLKLKEIK